MLRCGGNLEDLDPDIIDVCPKLIRVYVEDTPLFRDERKLTALCASWPRMLWGYWDGVREPAD